MIDPNVNPVPKKFNYYIILYVVAGLLIIGLGIWYWQQSQQKKVPAKTKSVQQVSNNPQSTEIQDTSKPLSEETTKPTNTPPENYTQSPPLQLKTTNVPFDQLPGNFFPTDIPREKSLADVTQNYVVFTNQNKYQATRTFNTTEDLNVLYDRYDKYFGDTGWTIINTLNQASLKSIAASKPKQVISASISENSITHQRSVDISFTYDSTRN